MMRTEPSTGDFVVEYTDPSRRRDRASVVIVHLTSEVGPEEVFWSSLPQAGTHAERLAATWALEDGTCAWRLSGTDTTDAVLSGITTDVAQAPNVAVSSNLLTLAIASVDEAGMPTEASSPRLCE